MTKIILTFATALMALCLMSCSNSENQSSKLESHSSDVHGVRDTNYDSQNKTAECGCQDLKILVGGMTYNKELVKLENKKLLPEEVRAMEIMDTYVYTADCEKMAGQGLYSGDSCVVRLYINSKTDYKIRIMKNTTSSDNTEKSFKYCKDFKSNLFCYRSR